MNKGGGNMSDDKNPKVEPPDVQDKSTEEKQDEQKSVAKKNKRIFSLKQVFKNKHKSKMEKRPLIPEDIKKAFSHINPRKVMLIFAVGLFGIYLLTGIYIVNPGEQAVIRRFGAVLPSPVNEGIHYRLPYPMDQVQKVNVDEVRRADVGMNLPEHMHTNDTPEPIELLTGDENIITSEVIVHYKVKDAAKFLYGVNNNNEQLVRFSVESSLVKVMSNVKVDDILSTGKVQAQNTAMRDAQEILDKYDSGIQLTAFNIQSITPPGSVAESFRDVTTAREDKEKAINQARGYYNSLIPESRGKAQTMLSEAEGYKAEQMNKAIGDTDKFLSILQEKQCNLHSRYYQI